MSREELQEAQRERSREFGIEVVEGAALTFPSGFPEDLRLYGDPVNLKYPVNTPARAANARARFKQNANQYREENSRRIVHTRIVEAELDFGISVSIDPEDPLDMLLPRSLRDRIARMQSDAEGDDVQKAGLADLTKTIAFTKQDAEQRLVTGIVLEPDEVDAHDHTVSAAEIEQAAHRFMSRYNEATELGVQHEMFPLEGLDLAESYIAPVDFEMGGQRVKKGTWVMVMKVTSDSLWEGVKEGRFTGFSIGGRAYISPVE